MSTTTKKTRATLKDIARELNISATAVSQALNGKGRLSEPLRRKVEEAASSLGYRPNPAARVLRGTKTQSIGVVINFFNNPFFRKFFIGLEEVTAPAGIHYWVSQTHDVFAKEETQIQTLADFGVDGIILLPCSETHTHLDTVSAQFDIPFVLISHNMGERFAAVQADNVKGAELAAEHLLSLGNRPVVHIAGPLGKSGMRERMQGFCNVMSKTPGFAVDSAVFFVDALTSEEGGRVMGPILERHGSPVSVFVANDDVALGVLTFCIERGLNLPDDVAVVGFSDIDILQKLNIPLTSINIPQKRMGHEAGKILLDLIRNPEHRQNPPVVTMPVSLVVRQSTVAG